jgi:plastocyanin
MAYSVPTRMIPILRAEQRAFTGFRAGQLEEKRMGKVGMIIVAVLSLAVLAACGSGTSSSDKTSTAIAGGGVGGAQTAPAASPTTAAAASPTTAAAGTSTAAPSGTGTAASGSPSAGGGSVTLEISTPDDTKFDKDTLNAAAGAQVTLTYTNNSDLPHNFHLFNGGDASGDTIAMTDVKTGPNDVEKVTFTAPTTPGKYFYHCDVHPQQMTGFLVVQ